MRGNLATIFIILTVLVQTVGLLVNFPWKGLIIWALSVLLLLFAAYFTRFNKKYK